MKTKQSPVDFFCEHAGYSYDPRTETKEEGRHRCAQTLAQAEEWARDNDITFAWGVDGDSRGEGVEWTCAAFTDDGRVVASLCGIDLGDSSPFNYSAGHLGAPTWTGGRHPYCRVIEAELALEAFCDVA